MMYPDVTIVPHPEPYDRLQEALERREAHIRTSLRWEHIRTDFLTKLALAWMNGEGTLGEILEQLRDAPIISRWDLAGYLKHNGARDAKALGQQVLTLLATTVLEAVEAVNDEVDF
jgi:hypothetical protein